MLRVQKRLSAGEPGTKKLQRKFGDELLFVRYRLDEENHERVTTVEIVVDRSSPVAAKGSQAPVSLRHPETSQNEELRILKKIIEGLDSVSFPTESAVNVPATVNEPLRSATSNEDLRTLLALQTIEKCLSRLLYIEADSPYCSIVFDWERDHVIDTVRLSLKQIESYFPQESLVRIHRTHLVNTKRILSFDHHNGRPVVWLKDSLQKSGTLPVGRTHLKRLTTEFPQLFKSS